MAVQIEYDQDGRLNFKNIFCQCGGPHNQPALDIYVGTRLMDQIPFWIRKRNLGWSCVLVSDDNTWPLAGQRLTGLLRASGFSVKTCTLHREGELEPDERACGEVLLTMERDTTFLVSVGSGSITDITRLVAVRTGKPFVCVATAPSMDGYTSVVAPLLLRGVKIHREAVCPEIIICDLDILRTAPMRLIRSGVGDVLGKYIAHADWQIGRIILDEPYCDACGEITMQAANRLLENISAISERSEKGIRILTEALLLSGVTVLMTGHTRAVASIEHNIVHVWDMLKLLEGQRQPPHGAAVGVATLLVWPLYLRFAEDNLSRLDLKEIQNRKKSREAREQWLHFVFKEEAAAEIMRENPEDFLDWAEQERRIRKAMACFDDVRQVIMQLPPLDQIRQALQKIGAPLSPEELGIERDMLNLSLHAAKDYRSRYSLFKLLDECGLLEEYLSDYPVF